ncbi:MAG: triose-phosphate isomerase, partial [candidate division Zixibacteria bacterium]|nr:triose-phosphate isomerase [candidate division Zixibacteria bacterium]
AWLTTAMVSPPPMTVTAPLEEVEKVVIAYEPVWAIGTGKNATPKQANEIHAFIREKITSMYNKDTAQKMYIIYGGSVTPESADDLIEMPEINGFLVGGASLDPEAFEKIVRASVTPKAAVK